MACSVGHTLTVAVCATNAGRTTQACTATATTVTDTLSLHDALPISSAPTNSALPAISGSVVEGQTLSASTGVWTGEPTSYAYQWQDCDVAGEIGRAHV